MLKVQFWQFFELTFFRQDPAVFNVATGSFATAPVPPEFNVDATGGQWRRGNRGKGDSCQL